MLSPEQDGQLQTKLLLLRGLYRCIVPVWCTHGIQFIACGVAMTTRNGIQGHHSADSPLENDTVLGVTILDAINQAFT